MTSNKLNRLASQDAKNVETLLFADQTVDSAIDHIRRTHTYDSSIVYFYVVDSSKRLLGTVSAKDLLISDPNTLVTSLINTRVKTIHSKQKNV